MTQQSVLVIDDDVEVTSLICDVATRMGFHCVATQQANEFLAAVDPSVDLIILDLMIPDRDGIELLRILGEREVSAGIILTSGVGARVMDTASALAESLGLTVAGRLAKPFRIDELRNLLSTWVPGRKVERRRRPYQSIADNDLRAAICTEQLLLHFQPQIDVKTRQVRGFEALARWDHPVHGLLFPNKFVRRMEDLGLATDLFWCVAKRACQAIRHCQLQSVRVPSMSINLSASCLENLQFPDAFLALLQTHAIDPSLITLEITETGLLGKLSRTLDVLTRLRMKGISLSIDDFGTGYSTMQQLSRIPATEIKIDRSFVGKCEDHQGERVLVRKIIEIGRELDLCVVAEGVETSGQMDMLVDLNCDVVQGFLFAKPMPLERALSFLNH